MMYLPNTNTKIKLHFLNFPKSLKETLINLKKISDPKHALPTNSLKESFNSWLENIVDIKPLRMYSDDQRWLISMEHPDVDKVCGIIKIWITNTFSKKGSDEINNQVKKIAESISAEQFHVQDETISLFMDNGEASCDYAFRAFTVHCMTKLVGKKLKLFGQEVILCWAGIDELVTTPIYPKKGEQEYPYSFVIRLSMQTTPPHRKVALICDISIRRFIAHTWGKPFLEKKSMAHVRVSENRYRKVAMKYDSSQKKLDWIKKDKELYNLYNFVPLPEALDVLCDVKKHYSDTAQLQILCPYANYMNFVQKCQVGTGVSIVDKCEIYQLLFELLSNSVSKPNPPVVCGARHAGLTKSTVERREHLVNCIESDSLNIEVYCHSKDNGLAMKLFETMWGYFGNNDDHKSIININTRIFPLGELGDKMSSNDYNAIQERIEKVKTQLINVDNLAAAIIVLPGKEDFAGLGDPYSALRAGFADMGRITQFIRPKQDLEEASFEIQSAVNDLFRGLGYTEKIVGSRLPEIFKTPVIGVHVYTSLKPLRRTRGKELANCCLPIYILYDPISGSVKVECDAFEKRHMLYWEAALELSKFSRSEEFVGKCKEAYADTIKQKLLGYRNLYMNKPAFVMINSNYNTRNDMWPGISDTSISTYQCISPYVPKKIDIGSKGREHLVSFTESQLRIMRVRINQGLSEIPDYYTELKKIEDVARSHRSASGIFQYDSIFWGLAARQNDPRYRNSESQSKIDHPFNNFAGRNLVEFFPLQLQDEDIPLKWVQYANALRKCSLQYPEATKLPLPLHFADLLKEYLLIKNFGN